MTVTFLLQNSPPALTVAALGGLQAYEALALHSPVMIAVSAAGPG